MHDLILAENTHSSKANLILLNLQHMLNRYPNHLLLN